MDFHSIKGAVESINMPDEMSRRITNNCRNIAAQTKENDEMKENKRIIRRPMVAVAVIALCVCLCVSAFAMSGSFRDIKRLDGAVIGTAYENAHNEIDISAHTDGNALLVKAELLLADEFPYREFEQFEIGSYKIVNASGKTILNGQSEAVELNGSLVEISLPLAAIEEGNYKLIITSFVGSKKADQPLSVTGHWECDFTV